MKAQAMKNAWIQTGIALFVSAIVAIAGEGKANAAPAVGQPKADSHVTGPNEELIPLGNLTELSLKKDGDGWNIGLVDQSGQYHLFTYVEKIVSVSQFVSSPALPGPYKRPWSPIVIKESDNQHSANSSWSLIETNKGLKYIRARSLVSGGIGYVMIDLPSIGSHPFNFASHSVILAKEPYYLLSLQEQNGQAYTYAIRARDGTAFKISDKFTHFKRGSIDLFKKLDSTIQFTRESGATDLNPIDFARAAFSQQLVVTHAQAIGDPKAGLVAAGYAPVGDAIDMDAEAARYAKGYTVEGSPVPDVGSVVDHMMHNQAAPAGHAYGSGGASSTPTVTQGENAKPAASKAAKILPEMRAQFNHLGNDYTIFTLSDKQKFGTFVRRDHDGLTVKIAASMAHILAPETRDETAFAVEDGILRIPELMRQIDLDRFELEVKFVPASAVDAGQVEWLDENFRDLRTDGHVQIKPTKGRFPAVKKIFNFLREPQRSSVILTGEAGDSEDIIREAVSALPRTWRFKEFDLGNVGADMKYSGGLAQVSGKIIKAVEAVPTVFFKNGFESLKGEGQSDGKPSDILEKLRDSMNRGYVKFAAVAGRNFFNRIKDPNFVRTMNLNPLDPTETLEAIHLWLQANPSYPVPSDEFIHAIMETAAEYQVTKGDPDRSIDLLLTAIQLMLGENMHSPDDFTQDLLNRAVITEYREIPEYRDQDKLRLRLKNLIPTLSQNIIDMDHIILDLFIYTRGALSGIHDGRGPLFSMLLLGPPGVGKTEIFTAYADAMGLPFERIDLNQYDGKVLTADDLMGLIAAKLRENRRTVFLLDEADKCPDRTVLQALLKMFDNEKFVYYEKGEGERKETRYASARHAIFGIAVNSMGDTVSDFFNNLSAAEQNRPSSEIAKHFESLYPHDYIVKQLIASGIPSAWLDRVKTIKVAFPVSAGGMVRMLKLKLRSLTKIIGKTRRLIVEFPNIEQYLENLVVTSRAEALSQRTIISTLQKAFIARAGGIIENPQLKPGDTYQVDFNRAFELPQDLQTHIQANESHSAPIAATCSAIFVQ